MVVVEVQKKERKLETCTGRREKRRGPAATAAAGNGDWKKGDGYGEGSSGRRLC